MNGNEIKIDVVFDLAYGDCGKGKVTHALSRKNNYTHVIRFSGGGNAGHTIYHNGIKFVTHLIPSGVFNGVKSIIGPGCVVNPTKLHHEINYLTEAGIKDVDSLVKVAKNAHIVTMDHVMEESEEKEIGTTKTGNGPAYRDKYMRKGIRAEAVSNFISTIDMHEEFYDGKDKIILAEGAQGFYLDPDWGHYPYVTSSHCGIGSVLLNGFNHKQIRKVYGVIKAYETYVGAKKFEGDDPVFPKIRQLGHEYGATTGRSRQVNWINFNELIQAINMNGIDELLVNKIDILRELNVWKTRNSSGVVKEYQNETDFRKAIQDALSIPVVFSDNPHEI